MTMNYSIDKTIKDNILEIDSAKKPLKFIGDKFNRFDQIERA